jgi:hypothetical protein
MAMNGASTMDGWRWVTVRRILGAHRFHLWMAYACAGILVISVVVCKLTLTQLTLGDSMIALLVVLAGLLPLPLYWDDKQRIDMREGAMTILWAFVLAVILPFSVWAATRVGTPLQDATLVRLDAAFGVSVPRMMTWASHHLLGEVANWSYALLIPLLPIAAFAPGLTGKWKDARAFLVANLVAFAIGLVGFALLPAVGPWYGYHFAGTAQQMRCQTDLLLMRIPGLYSTQAAGVVCFPSFHVIWAVLCARALWGFKYLRLPISILSGMIILSTMTTGWHYFSDVLAGVIVAILSIAAARVINSKADYAMTAEIESDPLEMAGRSYKRDGKSYKRDGKSLISASIRVLARY